MLILIENQSDGGGIVTNAEDIYTNKRINESDTLHFRLPITSLGGLCVGRSIGCEGEVYIVESVSYDNDEGIAEVSCTHEFLYHAKRLHIPSFASTSDGDFIGVEAEKVLKELDRKLTAIMGDYGYRLLTDKELEQANLSQVIGKIDYESEDKVTLWSVLANIISALGYGEIYYTSNWSEKGEKGYSLVKRIGRDTETVLSGLKNMNNIKIEYDITDMVTMLWPYGENDMDIVNAPQNKDKTPYIISPNAEFYGAICGYKSYEISDATEAGPEKLFNRAVWEFDSENPDRIDVPSVNISGNTADMMISPTLQLGDTVSVMDKGMVLRERIISIKRYPYSGEPSELSIGRVKRDLFFYLNQVGVFTKKYKDISAQNGKIYGSKVTGKLKTTAVAAEEAVTLLNSAGQIVIDSNGIRVLSGNGAFFSVDKNSAEVGGAFVVKEGIAGAELSQLRLNGLEFTTDEEGNLYFNSKKVQLIGGGE